MNSMAEQMITLSLAAKLGHLAVHAKRLSSTTAPIDVSDEINRLMNDAEVQEFLEQLDALSLLPFKNDSPSR